MVSYIINLLYQHDSKNENVKFRYMDPPVLNINCAESKLTHSEYAQHTNELV